MKRISRKDFVSLSALLIATAIFCGLLSRHIGASWIRTVIGFILISFPILLTYRMAQRRKHEREAERKLLKSDNSGSHTTAPNAVGKALVAQRRRKLFFNLRMWGISALFGLLAGLTMSGFWSGS